MENEAEDEAATTTVELTLDPFESGYISGFLNARGYMRQELPSFELFERALEALREYEEEQATSAPEPNSMH